MKAMILAQVRRQARELANLLNSGETAIDTWRCRPIEDYSEMELLEIADYLGTAIEKVRANRECVS